MITSKTGRPKYLERVVGARGTDDSEARALQCPNNRFAYSIIVVDNEHFSLTVCH